MPDAGAGRRVPAAVRAAPGARPGRAGDDRRDGRPRGVHRGQATSQHAKQMLALDRDPRDRRRLRGRVRPRLRRARAPLPHRGRRDDRRRARLGARHDRGRRRRAARGGRARSARSASRRSARSRSTRSATRCRRATRVVVLEKALAVGVGGIVAANVRMALSGVPAPRHDRHRRARRPADHAGVAARHARRRAHAGELEALYVPRPRHRPRRARARAHAASAPLRPARREHPARPRRRRAHGGLTDGGR